MKSSSLLKSKTAARPPPNRCRSLYKPVSMAKSNAHPSKSRVVYGVVAPQLAGSSYATDTLYGGHTGIPFNLHGNPVLIVLSHVCDTL